jgi:hypothetical protein
MRRIRWWLRSNVDEALSDWLALREGADVAARSAALTRAVVERLPHEKPLRAVDLGTGTGSNVRYLMPRLPADAQQWLLVDRDRTLLTLAVRSLRPVHSIVVETREMNLGALDSRLFARRDLVTASALLDLVSEAWLRALANECRAAGATVLFALTYNGRSNCTPAEPEDEMIRELMNRHQRQNDKGFGIAAGPDAVDAAERSFADVGYQVRREPSDWALAPDAQALQRQLVEGWAFAAREMAPDRTPMIDDWLRRRLAHIAADRSQITVGHEDLAAWPKAES